MSSDSIPAARQTALQRRGHRGSHNVRTGAGIKVRHLDRGIIDFRKRGNRQLQKRPPTSRIAAINREVATGRRMNGREGLRDAALRWRDGVVVAGAVVAGAVVDGALVGYFVTRTFDLSCSFSKPLLATISPASISVTCVTKPSVIPGVTFCM